MRTMIVYEGGPLDGESEEWRHEQPPPPGITARITPSRRRYGGIATAAHYRIARRVMETETIETERIEYQLEAAGVEVACCGGDGS